jgi:hypothetical protein
MRLVRTTDQRLTFAPQYIDSNELRFDRMSADPIKVMQSAGGSFSFEFSYPEDNSPLSELYRSAFYNTWVNTPTWDNDGVAASVITAVAATTLTVIPQLSGDVAVGHLIKLAGFAAAANNTVARVTTAATSAGASIVCAGATFTVDASPAAGAKVKVVGFEGAVGDIVATSAGLTSTLLDFRLLGLHVGQWIKIGGTLAVNQFPHAPNNDFCRVAAIAQNLLTLDNKPTGWAADAAGSGNNIRVWVGDTITNGAIQTTVTLEVGFMDQATPTYIINTGMTVNTLDHNLTARQTITGTFAFTGQGGGQSTATVDSSPDAATTNRVMAAHANVGRLAEAGAPLVAPNWARSLTFQVNNNNRTVEDIASSTPQAINVGECTVTGRVESYFGDNVMLQKMYLGTPSSLSTRWQKDNQAVIWQFPRVTFRAGDPQATGKNTDIALALDFQAAMDPVTNSQVILDRFYYYE